MWVACHRPRQTRDEGPDEGPRRRPPHFEDTTQTGADLKMGVHLNFYEMYNVPGVEMCVSAETIFFEEGENTGKPRAVLSPSRHRRSLLLHSPSPSRGHLFSFLLLAWAPS